MTHEETAIYMAQFTFWNSLMHAYLLNSACFWEEIKLEALGPMFVSSYAFSFCFNCRIFKMQKNIKMLFSDFKYKNK